MEITSSLPTAAGSASTATTTAIARTATRAASFADTLTHAVSEKKSADFVSGRIGIDLNSDGVPAQIVYLDEQGNKLTSSTFSAESILRHTQQLGISLTDLKSLGTQLDTAGVGYRPYELYKGTGSDHGIDFDDLIAGGFGTAYDWTKDANAAAKGAGALQRLEKAGDLAKSLNLTAHAAVTHNKGIDPSRFTPQTARGGPVFGNVMFNGSVAAWYGSFDQATQASKLYGGTVTVLAAPANSTADTRVTARASSSASSPALAGTAIAQVASASPSATRSNAQLQALIDSLPASRTSSQNNPLLQALGH